MDPATLARVMDLVEDLEVNARADGTNRQKHDDKSRDARTSRADDSTSIVSKIRDLLEGEL